MLFMAECTTVGSCTAVLECTMAQVWPAILHPPSRDEVGLAQGGFQREPGSKAASEVLYRDAP